MDKWHKLIVQGKKWKWLVNLWKDTYPHLQDKCKVKLPLQYQVWKHLLGRLWRKAVSCIAGRLIKWCSPVTDLGISRRPVITPLGIYTENNLPQINSTCIMSFMATLFVTAEDWRKPDVCQQRPACTTETLTQWNTVQCFEQAVIVSMY